MKWLIILFLGFIGLFIVMSPFKDPFIRYLVGPLFIICSISIPSFVRFLDRIDSDKELFRGSFDWTGPMPSDEEIGAYPETLVSHDFGEQFTYQATQPVALCIFEVVKDSANADINNVNNEPFSEDHGWYVPFIANGWGYDLLLQPNCGPERESFYFDAIMRYGWIRRVIFREKYKNAVTSMRQVITELLQSTKLVANIQWEKSIPVVD